MSAGRRRIVITGAAGRVGRRLVDAWQARYALTLVDVLPIEPVPGAIAVQADVRDAVRMRAVCDGADTVVHLAISGNLPHPRALHHPVNVDGALVAMRAAADAGCRRFVQASSLAIVLFPEKDYSAMKLEVEQTARTISESTGLSIHLLRLGQVMPASDRLIWPDSPVLPYVLTHGDLRRLFTCSVEAPDEVRFGCFVGISRNSGSPHDITETTRVLGYRPADDVPALARQHYRSGLGLLRRAKRRLKTGWNLLAS